MIAKFDDAHRMSTMSSLVDTPVSLLRLKDDDACAIDSRR